MQTKELKKFAALSMLEKILNKEYFMRTLIATLIAVTITAQGFSCTDFILKAKDNSTVVGRSMEFGEILPTQVKIVERGEENKEGLQWKSKYKYVAMFLMPARIVIDGFNEKGLSIGALWMPGTQYPAQTGSKDNSLSFKLIGAWALGNFATVDEVKANLEKVTIFAESIPGFSSIPPIHLSIHDATGKSAVVEFLNGKMVITDNPIGVLTNAPEFSWHMTNLRNYINLSPVNAKTLAIDGTVLEPTGQGTGLMGIPGDWTPPSRFVRTAIFKQILTTPDNAKNAVLSAIHLLNTVDIPYGAIRGDKTTDFDFTQWIVIKDLANKKLYVRTYPDQNIQTIDLMNSSAENAFVDLNTKP